MKNLKIIGVLAGIGVLGFILFKNKKNKSNTNDTSSNDSNSSNEPKNSSEEVVNTPDYGGGAAGGIFPNNPPINPQNIMSNMAVPIESSAIAAVQVESSGDDKLVKLPLGQTIKQAVIRERQKKLGKYSAVDIDNNAVPIGSSGDGKLVKLPQSLYKQQVYDFGNGLTNRKLYKKTRMISQDEKTELIFQEDGNFVLYHEKKPIWDSSTVDKGEVLILQEDGNVVIYDSNEKPVWASNTENKNASKLFVLNGGQFIITDNNWQPLFFAGNNVYTSFSGTISDSVHNFNQW